MSTGCAGAARHAHLWLLVGVAAMRPAGTGVQNRREAQFGGNCRTAMRPFLSGGAFSPQAARALRALLTCGYWWVWPRCGPRHVG